MCRLHVACWPWVSHTCVLSVFVSAPSPQCEFLGLMSLSCTSIPEYSGHALSFLFLLMCKCKFSWILCSIIFDNLNSLWLSVMLSQVFIWFAEILLSTHQFGFSFQGLRTHDEFMLLILSRTFFHFSDLFFCIPDFLLWVLVWILLQICTFFHVCCHS